MNQANISLVVLDMETGGVTIKSGLQKSNSFATPGCADISCVLCKGGRGMGGNCRKSNIQYSMECGLCPDENPTEYIGAGEHFRNY